MTTSVQTKDIAELGRRIDDAYERTKIGHTEWIEGSIELAVAHAEARECFNSTNEFGAWRVANGHDHHGKDDCAALVGLGSDARLARTIFEDSNSTSYQLIWRANKDRYRSATNSTPEPTSPPEPQPEPATEAEVKKSETPKTESDPTRKKSSSRLYELGDEPAGALLKKFKHGKMLTHFLGTDSQKPKRARLLRYLAKRIETDYPEELFDSTSWDVRLLYPSLPQKLLDREAKTHKLLHKNHSMLAATEELFMKTPECGITDPPLVAFNKAYSIYQAVNNAKNKSDVDIDRSSLVHTPTFASDEGKPLVIVRGTQLWPRESGDHHSVYRYDDLRCAYGLADDILGIYADSGSVSIKTKSQKLYHLLAWIPPGGYNTTGATLEGTMVALKVVVQAYGSNVSDMMRPPIPSLIKKGEG